MTLKAISQLPMAVHIMWLRYGPDAAAVRAPAQQRVPASFQVSNELLVNLHGALWCCSFRQPAPTWCGLNWAQG